MGFHDFSELGTDAPEVRDVPASKAFDPDKLVTRETVQETGDDPGRNVEKSFDPDKLVMSDEAEPRNLDDGKRADVPGENLEANAERRQENTEAESVESSVEDNDKYHDDAGNAIREGDRLLSNIEYIKNGYGYKTDSLGRIVSAEGELHVSDDGRKNINESMMTVSGGESWLTDHRGHLIADIFGGSPDLSNLVAMDGVVNQIDYWNVEKRCLSALREGKQVYLKTEVQYEGDSRRPSGFVVTTVIDGEKTVTRIGNRSEGSIKC